MPRIRPFAALLVCAFAATAFADDKLPTTLDLTVGGKPWLRTMCAPLDITKRDDTYKVYTHILNFEGAKPITKGPGGLYPHHRGLFIGWRDTVIGDKHTDSWHCPQSYQQLQAVIANKDGEQQFTVNWNDENNKTYIKETRTIRAKADGDRRLIDFESSLKADQKIELKGDLQHAGMHVRMEQEVAERDDLSKKAKKEADASGKPAPVDPDATTYILPVGGTEEKDDKVVGAWWVCCSCVVDGKRYWLVHMSPPSTPGGVPVYSIRRYARFGSFFEPTIEAGKPLDLHFRIVVSEKELDQKACQGLYDAFAKEMP